MRVRFTQCRRRQTRHFLGERREIFDVGAGNNQIENIIPPAENRNEMDTPILPENIDKQIQVRADRARDQSKEISEAQKENLTKIQADIARIDTQLNDPNHHLHSKETDALVAEKQKLLQEQAHLKEQIKDLRPAPKTHGERLGREMGDAIDDLENAKTSKETWAAIGKFLGALMEWIQRFSDKTLNDPLDKKKEDSQEVKNKDDAKAKLDQALDDRKADTPAKRAAETVKIRQETEKKLADNTKEIKAIDDRFNDLQGRRRAVGEELQHAEDELTDAKRKGEQTDSLENKVKGLKEQFDAIQKNIAEQIEIKKKLESDNKSLQATLDAIDDSEKGLDVNGLNTLIESLNRILLAKGVNFSITCEFGPENVKITISNVPDELLSKLPAGEKNPDGSYTISILRKGGVVPELPKKPEPSEKPKVEIPKEVAAEPSPEKILQGYKDSIKETTDRIAMVIKREQSHIDGVTKDRESSGLFGKFNRLVTTSDPYEIEIQNSKQQIAIAKNAQRILDQATSASDKAKTIEFLNMARRGLGMREVQKDFSASKNAPVGQRTIRGTEHFDVEQEAIDVSRDVAIDAVVTAGTLGGAAAANVGRKGVQIAAKEIAKQGLKQAVREGAIAGAVTSGGVSSIKNTDEVFNKGKGLKEGVKDVAKDTVIGAAAGAAIGGAVNAAGKGIDRIRTPKEAKAGSGAASPKEGPKAGPKAKEAPPEEKGKSTGPNPKEKTKSENPKNANDTDSNSKKQSTKENPGSEKLRPIYNGQEIPKNMKEVTAYKILGLKQGATRDEIKAAHRAMVVKNHPDKHTDAALKPIAERNMQWINAAHDRLKTLAA